MKQALATSLLHSRQKVDHMDQVVDGEFNRLTTFRTDQRITTQQYDEQNRVNETIAPDSSFTRMEYDQEGRVKAEIDQLGYRKDFSYNSSGQLAQVELPAVPNPLAGGASTRPTYQHQYNSFGQISKLIDANNHIKVGTDHHLDLRYEG